MLILLLLYCRFSLLYSPYYHVTFSPVFYLLVFILTLTITPSLDVSLTGTFSAPVNILLLNVVNDAPQSVLFN
jgi:hypothetical protein